MSAKPRLRASHSRKSGALVLDIPTIDLGKPRNRWRLAFNVIYSMRALRSLAKEIVANTTHTVLDINPNSDLVLDTPSTELGKPRQRWRLAFNIVVYSMRALCSLAKEIVANTTHTDLDINPNSDLVLDTPSIDLGKPRQRWRLAFNVIYSMRALQSLATEIVAKTTHTVLDINPNTDYHTIVDPRHFANVDQRTLIKMMKEKNLDHLHQLGEVKGIVDALETDFDNGIHGDDEDLKRRREAFGSNTCHKPPPKDFLHFLMEAFKDATIIILLVCATLSLGFGIKENGLKEGWYDGGSTFFAVFLVVAVSAVTKFRQSRQFDRLSKDSNNIQIDVVRNGRQQHISIFDIVVGDVVSLKFGDQIPADGLFLNGHSLQVDESSMTGESDYVEIDDNGNSLLLSGTKVADGYARMVVTSVGMNTTWGEMMSSTSRNSNERTPLQSRLEKLTSDFGKVGLVVAFLVLVVLLIRYFTGYTKDEQGNREFIGKRTKINDVFNAMVRIVVAAIDNAFKYEGLLLAVTFTPAYPMKRMMVDKAMVQKLSACETIGSLTVICTNKTGTLTMNEMTVTEFWLGKEAITSNVSNTIIAPDMIKLLHQGVGFNTTCTFYKASSGFEQEFSRSPIEEVILSWAVQELDMDIDKLKESYNVLHVETFNSEKKRSGVLTRNAVDNTLHIHWKGAAEIVLALCSKYYDKSGIVKGIDEGERKEIMQIIEGMAAKALRCIAFAHKKITKVELDYNDNGNTRQKLNEEDLIFLGVVGLKDPCQSGVREAVQVCKNAGVKVKMITGDNIFTARAIAIECGILGRNQNIDNIEVVEGVEFRNYTLKERMERVDKIQVMARSSPLDKLLMVQCLKQKGHVVAVTGDVTNDALALREADVGFSMGIQGTEVAKESSDIVILDDKFTSVVTVLKWGRCVYNNIQKFIQFQLTVNVAALVINLVAACSTSEVSSTTVQLLWVNLIIGTLGALALVTERPTHELMEKPPVGQTAPLITNVMWRNLIFQAIYQVVILLTLQFKGKSILNMNEKVKDTLIFNTFVLCQVFNLFNVRKIEKKNVFKGMHKNLLFLLIVTITVVLQAAIVEFLKKYANTERLNWLQWGVCIGIAAMSWPFAWVVKCIPVVEKPFLNYIDPSLC